MENMEKIVFSKTLAQTEWKNCRIVDNLNKNEISEMKERGGDIVVFGSPGLAGQLIEPDLVDDVSTATSGQKQVLRTSDG